MNSFAAIGRLTRDIEVKIAGGYTIGNFSLANNYIKKGETDVNFINCVMFGKLVDSIGKYMTKGKQLAITGELRQNRYQVDGQSRSKWEIIVNTVQLLGNSGSGNATRSTEQAFEANDEQFEDDIPF